ncbi:MAG: ATP synthase F1 subunit delta [Solidesulfovibrio sp. DCME]|uniref:ATP synthase F1 subunit delta n=1 Tax=Solidesulfovibrio sp. DCME TaxID=3447380 RepID=UPI003D0FCBB7
MTGNIVARRYAKALFALAKKAGKKAPAEYGKDLEAFAEVLEASPDLLKVFANPVIAAEDKKAVLAGVVGKLGLKPMVVNFLSLLADKDRLSFVLEVSAFYRALLDEAEGVLRGQLVTAYTLTDQRQDQIKAKLEKQSGKKLVLSFGVDPAILGGVLLKVGDKVLDASLRAQLEILKEQIKRGE